MIYGALILLACIVLSDTPWSISVDTKYLSSLLYLAVFGSIIGFTTYLSLVARLGANQAAYTTVMFPVVALTISTWFEGYQWTLFSIIGLVLVLLGNAIALGGLRLFRRRLLKLY